MNRNPEGVGNFDNGLKMLPTVKIISMPFVPANILLKSNISEPPVALTGKYPWLRSGWKILPTRIGYCSNTNDDRRFRRDDNNVAFTNVQLHYYHVRQVDPCHLLG